MSKLTNWVIIFVVVAACTCGGRTECENKGQISLLTGIHDDGSCRKISNRGVLLYEASQLLIEQYNSKTSGFKLELAVLDTCGSITGALKAAMKALVSADVSCLQPPHYLGIIGPDNPTNAEAVQKVTSVLRVPHLVRKPSTSAFLHHLAMENNSYIVQGILKVIESLKWKTFTLVAPSDEDDNDDVQNIAKKLTVESIARNLCVLIYDSEEGDFTKNVIHIGKPEDSFFNGPINATIIVVSEGRLENELSHINTSNTIVLLEDDRNELTELQARVEKSKWWSGDRVGKFDPEELREVRWLRDAIKSYGTALDSICKKKKCKSQINSADWNEMISKILSGRNVKTIEDNRGLNILMKSKEMANIENVGKIVVKNNIAKLSWMGENNKKEGGGGGGGGEEKERAKSKVKKTKTKKEIEEKASSSISDEENESEDNNSNDDENDDDDDDDDDDEEERKKNLPIGIKKIIEKSKTVDQTSRDGCAFDLHEEKLTKDEDDHATHILVSEMDDTEWWTMVGTVSGVGVAMFVVGILAVYIVYTNIRGPRNPKGQSSSSGRRYSLDRDTSLRRVGSDREMPVSGGGNGNGRNQRQQRNNNNNNNNNNSAHRRDSIRSNMSDRSV